MPSMQDIPKKEEFHKPRINNAYDRQKRKITMIHKQIVYVSAYIGNVVLENVTDDDLHCITESLEGMVIAGLIDLEFINEIHGW